MKEHYQKLKNAILKDVNHKLDNTLEEKTAERIKKDLDIAAECQTIIDGWYESVFESLSEEAQLEIHNIIARELNGEESEI